MAATPDGKNVYTEAVATGLWREIPVFRMLLGTCPTLAVTAAVKPALTMGLCVIFVLVCSNIMVSLMRKGLRPHVRILLFTLTIATFVTIADLFLRAYQPAMSQALGPYVPLIIVNCVIIWRAEACASKSGVLLSIVDGLAMDGLHHRLVHTGSDPRDPRHRPPVRDPGAAEGLPRLGSDGYAGGRVPDVRVRARIHQPHETQTGVGGWRWNCSTRSCWDSSRSC